MENTSKQLIVGAAASLIATILWVGLGTISHLELLSKQLELRVVGVIILGMTFAFFVGCLIAKRRRPQMIFIVLSSYPAKPYFASLLSELLAEFDLHNVFVSVLRPATVLDRISQQTQLEKILKFRTVFAGGLLIPVSPEARKEELVTFAKTLDRPVVFVDVPAFSNHEDYPENTAFVGYDNMEGGRIAADAMAYELKKAHAQGTLRVLVLGASVVPERQQAFISRLTERLPGTDITKNEQPFHSREKAREIISHLIDAFPYDGVFCTNDDMALGVVDCLTENEKRHGGRRVAVIGYDAIDEARDLINNSNKYLRNSVQQDVTRLAQESVGAFFRLKGGGKLDVRVRQMKPTPFKLIP